MVKKARQMSGIWFSWLINHLYNIALVYISHTSAERTHTMRSTVRYLCTVANSTPEYDTEEAVFCHDSFKELENGASRLRFKIIEFRQLGVTITVETYAQIRWDLKIVAVCVRV